MTQEPFGRCPSAKPDQKLLPKDGVAVPTPPGSQRPQAGKELGPNVQKAPAKQNHLLFGADCSAELINLA